jgi:hypothetical protein
MSILGEQVLLRAHLQSADRAPFAPTSQRLVRAARSEGLAGATVIRGLLGLGHHGLIRRSFLSLVGHVPVIVEIVDTPERIGRFIEGSLSRLMVHGLATLERARVMMYRHRESDSPERLDLGGLLTPLSTVPKLIPSATMQINEQGVLLRVFLGDSDKFERRWLYEAIVYKAKELGLAGATVLRGVEGFGAHSVVHSAGLVEMSTDLPIVVEIIDTEEKIRTLLPHLETMVLEGMITMERVMILVFPRDRGKSAAT